jgi:PKD domain
MNPIRQAVPNSLPTARRRATRLAPAAILFTATMLGAIGCSDDRGVGPLNPVELGYVDSVAPEELKREADAPEGEPVVAGSLSPVSPSLSAATTAAADPSYTVARITFQPESRTGLKQEPGGDDWSIGGDIGGLNLGFSFMFYGQTYNKFWIASNGAILFEFIEEGACCGAMIPLNDAPTPKIPRPKNNLIALAWTDFQPLPGQISWGVRGTAPKRRLIVDFNQVGYFQCLGCAPSAAKVTTQAILYEGTNVIEVHTTSQQNPGKFVTQGVENRTGTAATFLTGRNRAAYTLANDGVRFTPVGQNAVPVVFPGGNAGSPVDRYEGVEGTAINFKGSGSDADGDPLTYTWDFDNDGIPDVTGSEATWTYADDSTYTATLTANDGRGGVGRASVSVIVKNAPPKVKANSNARINAGETVGFTGEFSDLGVNDARWVWTWNYGGEAFATDGVDSQAALIPGSHRFCKAGTFDVKLTIKDKDGDTGSDQVQVVVDALPVAIDISPNMINLNGTGHGIITVKIFSRTDLDATTLNPNSIKLKGVSGKGTKLAYTGGGLWQWNTDADLNGDGLLDVTAGFRRDELILNNDLNLNSTELALMGEVGDCGDVLGTAAVRVRVQSKDKSAAASLQPTGVAATPIEPSTP